VLDYRHREERKRKNGEKRRSPERQRVNQIRSERYSEQTLEQTGNGEGDEADVLLLNRTEGNKKAEKLFDLIFSRALCPKV